MPGSFGKFEEKNHPSSAVESGMNDEGQRFQATNASRLTQAAYDTSLQYIHLFPAKYRQSAHISVIVHRFRQHAIEHLLLGTAYEFRYSAAQST